MSAVSFARVSKRFDNVVALADLNLEIGTGEFVSLLGPSGSGKTTTLNLLAGLLPIDEGEIRIGGKLVNYLPPDRRDIAMVFQNYALYPHMTVFENIAFPLRARGRRAVGGPEIERRVKSVADTLGIGDLLARYPKELSGGQQQRVALGRGMVRDPKVFLLDEPLSNLDARLRLRMRRDLKALHEALKSTIVYVTHDQAEALTLSTRVAVFDQGQLQQFGTPEAIYSRPANMFVANFVGEREINFICGRIEPRGDDIAVVNGEIAVPLGAAARDFDCRIGQPVVLGIRMEGIVANSTSLPAHLRATIIGVERAGPDLVVFARTSEGLELCCRAEPHAHLVKDQTVSLGVLHDHLHLFDQSSQQSLRLPVTSTGV